MAPVADERAFGVGQLAVHRGHRPARRSPVCRGERGGQAGGLDVAEQGRGHRVAALLAGQARPEHGVNLLEPRHQHRRRRVDDNNRALGRRSHLPHELVLPARQPERCLVNRLGLLLVGQSHDNHSDVSLGRRPLGVGHRGLGGASGRMGDQGVQRRPIRPVARSGAGPPDAGLHQHRG